MYATKWWSLSTLSVVVGCCYSFLFNFNFNFAFISWNFVVHFEVRVLLFFLERHSGTSYFYKANAKVTR
jgi:hypothetical protein